MGTSISDLSLNTSDVTSASTDLYNATYQPWDGTLKGFYVNFVGTAWNTQTNKPDASLTPTKGEKAVNAPTAVNGQIFFSTNQPQDATNTCSANLGTARAYAINPFTGVQAQNVLAGGGLPPTAVSGVINIVETKDGKQVTTQEKFCIGCGLSGSQIGGGGGLPGGTNTTACTSALENCNVGVPIPKNLKRTYWYKK
jgi:type IV pilus assembly protein PilY1